MPFNNFTLSSIALTGVYQSSVAWGDYDNDGDLDILLTGKAGSNNPVAKVYRNDSGTFTDTGAFPDWCFLQFRRLGGLR